MNTKILFNNLIGTWQLSREISNYGTATGLAYIYLQDSKTIRYNEETTVKAFDLVLSYQAYQIYYYTCHDTVTKHFKDGRIFYTLKFIDNFKAIGDHQCLNDHYKASYEFISNNTFKLQYKITGPSKNCLIKTTFFKHT